MKQWNEVSRPVSGLAMAALLAVGTTACDDTEDLTMPSQNIVELASSSADLETLTATVAAAGLEGHLSGAGPFTVFAPTDASFDALPAGLVAALLESGNVDVLQELLLGHVVSGSYAASDLSDGQVLTTLSGDELPVTIEGGEVRIGGALVQAADVGASNGIVHVIGSVLTQGLNVVERARITPELATLVAAVAEGGLVSTLEGAGPFTVFTPTNAAFEAIAPVPSDPEVLESILLYHVVGQAALSTQLSDGQMLTTLEGGMLTVQLNGGVTIVGETSSANVGPADVLASNGVIHVVDTVLLPGSE